MFLLCSIQWCQPLHSATIFSASQFPDLAPSLAASLKDLDALMDMFKELQIDPAEFACLKAVVLFKPGPYLSLHPSYPQEYFVRSCWSQRQEGD